MVAQGIFIALFAASWSVLLLGASGSLLVDGAPWWLIVGLALMGAAAAVPAISIARALWMERRP